MKATGNSACLSLEHLERYARGVECDESCRAHMAECPSCQLAVDELRQNNDLLDQFVHLGAPTTPATAPVAGLTPEDVIPGYRILSEIHRGGQGIVYKAVQATANRTVAIKMMLAGGFATLAQRVRFQREIEIVANLRHPNIVTVYETGTLSGGRAAFAMEYVDGVRLSRWIEDSGSRTVDSGPLQNAAGAAKKPSAPFKSNPQALKPRIDAVLHLFTKICDAVNYAHQRGVIHRDLKPDNILVDSANEPHILDFGLAKALGPEGRSSATRTGEFMGTIAYAAPEQFSGDPERIDTRTDVYALGAILYELLAGRAPYATAGPLKQVIHNITEVEPPPPSSHNADVNDELDTIVLRALDKSPQRRYQSAGALLEDIRHYLDGEPIDAKRDSFSYVLRKQLHRYRVSVVFAGALAVAIIGGLASSVVAWRHAVTERNVAELARSEESRQRRLAEKEAAKADAINKVLDEILASVYPTGGRSRNLEATVRKAMDAAARRVNDGALQDQPDAESEIRQRLGLYYRAVGAYPEAESQLRRSLELRKNLFAPDSPQVMQSLNNLAAALQAKGDLVGAEAVLRELVAAYTKSQGPEADYTLFVRVRLAALLQSAGEWTEAAEIVRQDLPVARRVLGESNPIVAFNLDRLAAQLRAERNYDEAESVARQSVELWARIRGREHPYYVAALCQLADVFSSKGDFDAAEHELTAALAAYRALYGNEHPDVASVLFRLARVDSSCGKPDSAAVLLREALAIRIKLLGDAHRDTAEARAELDKCLSLQARETTAVAAPIVNSQ